jgi:glyoxylase-like metal-dependent hydrolase (beta-lactamase superfamily II)
MAARSAAGDPVMNTATARRHLLAALLAAAAAAVPADADPPPAATEIAPGVHLLRGVYAEGRQPDGNSVVFTAPEGPVVVDTGRHPAHTRAVLDLAASLGGPPRVVVNTHWHLDHVGGNVLVRREHPEVRVLASAAIEGALGGFLADYRAYLEGAIPRAGSDEAAAPLRAELGLIEAGAALAPDEVVSASGTRTLAGRKLELHLEGPAVTAGDLWLFDPASRTLVAGDLVTLPFPFLDTACPRGWQAALGRLAQVDFALLVPGHGAPMDRDAFTAWRRAFDGLLACAGGDDAAAACADRWLADAGALVAEADRDLARRGLLYYLENHLRDEAKIAGLCGG